MRKQAGIEHREAMAAQDKERERRREALARAREAAKTQEKPPRG
jgi:hypothetical protein